MAAEEKYTLSMCLWDMLNDKPTLMCITSGWAKCIKKFDQGVYSRTGVCCNSPYQRMVRRGFWSDFACNEPDQSEAAEAIRVFIECRIKNLHSPISKDYSNGRDDDEITSEIKPYLDACKPLKDKIIASIEAGGRA